MITKLETLKKECEQILTVNRTSSKGVEKTDPTGFLPPNKREEIIKIVKKMIKICEEA